MPALGESELLRLREQEGEAEATTNPREITLEGTGYKVVGSSLLLISMAAHYMQCVSSLGVVAAQAAHLLPLTITITITIAIT